VNRACRIIANDNPRILHLTGFVGSDVAVAKLFDVKGANATAPPALAQARSSFAKSDNGNFGSVLLGHSNAAIVK
jgi:hypothetical protein